ncbi:MAG: hypothetical protein KAH86_08140 [Methanosarcinales archaeon]|nr:hypothetical protein [Methanosarcinales archaeon]
MALQLSFHLKYISHQAGGIGADGGAISHHHNDVGRAALCIFGCKMIKRVSG